MAEKKVWDSQPGKERGSESRTEGAYLRSASRAIEAGRAAARDPAKTERDYPPNTFPELIDYFRYGFRKERGII